MIRVNLVLLAMALAVMACTIPKSFDELIGWSEGTTPDATPKDISKVLGSLPDILVAMSLTLSLFGLGYNAYMRVPGYRGLFTIGIILMFVSGMLVFFIPQMSMVGDLARGDLTIDDVFRSFHWDIDLRPTILSTQVVAIAVTAALPPLLSFYVIGSFALLIASVVSSIFGGNAEAVIEWPARLAGFALFLVLYRLLVVMAAFVPNNAFTDAVTEPFMNAFYLLLLGGLLTFCLHTIPQTTKKTFGRYVSDLQEKKVKVEVEHKHEHTHRRSRNTTRSFEEAEQIERERHGIRRTP